MVYKKSPNILAKTCNYFTSNKKSLRNIVRRTNTLGDK